MKIAMDTRETKNPRPTGKGLFAMHILKELLRRGIPVEEYDGEGGILWHWKQTGAIRKSKPDLYLSPTSFIVPWLLGKKVKTAVVIHDLIAFDDEPHDQKAMMIERVLLPRVLKTARFIFCVSEATKKDLLQRFPKTDTSKITVIYEGPTMEECHGEPFDRAQDKLRRTMTPSLDSLPVRQAGARDDTPYILSLGTLCPRKNQLRLIEAFNMLPNSLRLRTKLILAGGRGWDDGDIVELAEKSPNVEWRGYVPAQELDKLFAHATALAFPSFKEGFGLPVLDAMTLGVPVLTSNVSSMSEVAGDAALLVDPDSAEDIEKGLQRILLDPDFRSSLIAKGKERAKLFSWERTVDLMMKTMQEC